MATLDEWVDVGIFDPKEIDSHIGPHAARPSSRSKTEASWQLSQLSLNLASQKEVLVP